MCVTSQLFLKNWKWLNIMCLDTSGPITPPQRNQPPTVTTPGEAKEPQEIGLSFTNPSYIAFLLSKLNHLSDVSDCAAFLQGNYRHL